MVEKHSLQVKITSFEIIKPSKPTPPHLKSYKLSLVDQIHPPYYTIMLLFYPNSTKRPLDINNLKTSLSKTLTEFYPFAGRCNDDLTISCNDQGIPFLETRVNCNLQDFLNSPNKIDLMHEFLPSKEYKFKARDQPLQELNPLAFQINIFSCGGVVLGCFKLHKVLLDGTSLSTFLKYWAAVASERYNSLVQLQPNFDLVVSAFPPSLSRDWPSLSLYESSKGNIVSQPLVVIRSFMFSKDAITDLKAMSASESVPKPSRFVALAAFVWKHCMAAAYATGAMTTDSSALAVVVNTRPRLVPPITNTSMGNLITTVSVRKEVDTGLRDLVMQIHAAISNVKEQIEAYQVENSHMAAHALLADIGPLLAYKPSCYVFSSWCQFGLDEVDFGFGNPEWASPTNGLDTHPTLRNFIYFVNIDDGIEVWMHLEDREMDALLSDSHFLALASPT